MQVRTYLAWTGRFSATFLQAALTQWDLSTLYRWFCLATVVATLCAICVAVLTISQTGKLDLRTATMGAAATAVFVGGLPSSVEAFFWMASASTYQWGIITYLIWLTLIIRLVEGVEERKPGFASRALLVGLTGVLPGFAEVLTPIVLMTLAGFVVVCRRRRPTLHRFALTLLGVAVMSTALSLLAPGNALRSATYPDLPTRHNLAFALAETARQTTRFVVRFGSYPALWVAAFAAWWWAPGLVTRAAAPGGVRIGVYWPMVVVAVVFVTLFPLYWEYGDVNYTGEGRTYNVSFFAFCATAMSAVGCMLVTFSQRWPALNLRLRAQRPHVDPILAGILAVAIVGAPGTIQAFKALPQAPSYLAEQKARETVLRQPENRDRPVVVDALRTRPQGLFWGDLQVDEDHWINGCVATYYGVRSVRALPGVARR